MSPWVSKGIIVHRGIPAWTISEMHEAWAGESTSRPCLTEIILFEYNMLFQQF